MAQSQAEVGEHVLELRGEQSVGLLRMRLSRWYQTPKAHAAHPVVQWRLARQRRQCISLLHSVDAFCRCIKFMYFVHVLRASGPLDRAARSNFFR